MADSLKQIKEFPQKPDFGDEDLLLIQGAGTTYHVKGTAVKRYSEDAAKPQVELAKKEAEAAAAAADRAETAIQRPAIPDPVTGNWKVWDQEKGGYVLTDIRAEGQDFEIKGYYPTLDALEVAVPEPGKGYAYGVGTEPPYDIYVWDTVSGDWINNGPMTASGDMLKSMYDPQRKNQDIFAYADAAHVGRSMAGQTVEPTQGTTVTAGEGAEIFNDYRARTYGTDEGSTTIVAKTGNIASGTRAHAEGSSTTANGQNSHAEGFGTIASGSASHAEGGGFTGQGSSKATAYAAHAEGTSTTASGHSAHAEGRGTKAEGVGGHAEGQNTTASKDYSHAEGYGTQANGLRSHAEGNSTQTIGANSHAEGHMGIAEGSASHVEGGKITGEAENKASGYAAHAEGASTLASGNESHAEGEKTSATGSCAHAEGTRGIAEGLASHVEGGYFVDKGPNKATGYAAHAEGSSNLASGDQSHAEGTTTVASGNNAHAEGIDTVASGTNAHAEGSSGIASGFASHTEGYYTEASKNFSHARGAGTIASASCQTAIGEANVESTSFSDKLIIGKGNFIPPNGSGTTTRANCFRVNHGGVYASGSYNASGADYAELFEWADGNPEAKDRAGRFVTLEGKNIRLAGPQDDYILGIVSGNPSVVGDVHDDQWQGMYLTDVFGRPIWEDVEVPAVTEQVEIPVMVPGEGDESPRMETRTETQVIIPAHTERRQKLNPNYDPTQPYIPRSQRPEWDAVGMLGKLVAVDDGSCREDGWAAVGKGGIAVGSEERTRYRVMERLDGNHVRIMIL